jgi:uncharacterized membrane protein
MRQSPWLVTESEAWQRDGLITDDQRRAILARYAPAPSASTQASSALTWLAVIVAGIGAVVLVAWNWTAIPAAVKVLISAGPMLGLYAASAMAAKSGLRVRAERLALLASLFAGGVLFVTEDLSHVDPQRTNTLLLWSVVLAATALLVPSALTAAVATFVVSWWVLVAAGAPQGPWWFLAVWAACAVTVERAPNRWVAGGLTFAFGFWTFFAVLSVWNDQPGIPAIGVVLAGSWLDSLARRPAERRPAFARSTPALVAVLAGLILLMVSATHHAMSDWRLTGSSIWVGLALIAAFVGGTSWNAWRDKTWSSRPVALTALAVVWLVAWFTLPGHLRANVYLQWTWTAAFSAATVLMGASAVREAARTRDLGAFVVGLVSVVAFVIVRVLDARSLVVSGLMLIASALLLWWLARLWARPAAAGAAS